MSLNESSETKLDFVLMLNNEDFDNDDNPYGNFVMHVYKNMNGLNDSLPKEIEGFDDEIIPLKVCKDLG